MTRMIANAVLPLTKRHVRRRLHYRGPELRRSLKMLVDISDRDVHIPTYRGPIRYTVRPALTAEHDRTFTHGELCVAYHAIPLGPEPLRKAKRLAQPWMASVTSPYISIGTTVADGADLFVSTIAFIQKMSA